MIIPHGVRLQQRKNHASSQVDLYSGWLLCHKARHENGQRFFAPKRETLVFHKRRNESDEDECPLTEGVFEKLGQVALAGRFPAERFPPHGHFHVEVQQRARGQGQAVQGIRLSQVGDPEEGGVHELLRQCGVLSLDDLAEVHGEVPEDGYLEGRRLDGR